jgi:hypothetical protein
VSTYDPIDLCGQECTREEIEGRKMGRKSVKPKRSLKTLGISEHNQVQWEVIFHDEFFEEYQGWSEIVQDAVLGSLGKLRMFGPSLGRPTVDTLKGSRHSNMKDCV